MVMSTAEVAPRERRLAAPNVRLSTLVTVFTLLGLGLRLAAARGDLWLDEIWTFRLLDGVHSFGAIFLHLPYDNNHPLNTAWLALVGPDASPIVIRFASIVFGTLCIPVAARIGLRRGEGAAIFAAALAACDGLLVHYGSEARGYSGMILASLLALDALERFLADPARSKTLWVLAAATAFGTLSQPSMIMMSLALGLTAATSLIVRVGWSRGSLHGTLSVAAALAIGTLPAAICVLISLSGGALHTGVVTPFSWATFGVGIARLVEATGGVPDSQAVVWSFGVVTIAAFANLAGLACLTRERRIFPAVAIFGLPVLQALCGMPNEQFARFHIVTGLGLLILAIELVDRLSRIRRLGPALLASALAAQGYNLSRLIQDGRGSFNEPVTLMGADGAATVIVRPKILAGETGAVVRWYAAKSGSSVAPTEPACPADATWLLLAREPGASLEAPPQDIESSPRCTARFALHSAYPAFGLSGFTWLLFRRTP